MREAIKTKAPQKDKLEDRKFSGLCSTCKKALTCSFPRDPERPVLQCDEFEGYEPVSSKLPRKQKARKEEKRKTSKTKEGTKLLGLCANCAKRDTCTFPKSEGGVWYCEEYE